MLVMVFQFISVSFLVVHLRARQCGILTRPAELDRRSLGGGGGRGVGLLGPPMQWHKSAVQIHIVVQSVGICRAVLSRAARRAPVSDGPARSARVVPSVKMQLRARASHSLRRVHVYV